MLGARVIVPRPHSPALLYTPLQALQRLVYLPFSQHDPDLCELFLSGDNVRQQVKTPTKLTTPDIHTLYKAGGGDVSRETSPPPVDYAGKGSKLSHGLRTFEIRIQNPNNAVEILDISKLNSHFALTSTERNLNRCI